MLLNSQHSCLVLIDVQEKLSPHVHEPDLLIKNCKWLLEVANQLDVPMLASEHYAKGLGGTIPELKKLIPKNACMQKVHFSCASDDTCLNKIHALGRDHIVLIGIEAHICVLQTAIELLDPTKEIFVVADAVSSRSKRDMEIGLQRMQNHGVNIVTKEMVFFEWLKQAGTEEFRAMSKQFMK